MMRCFIVMRCHVTFIRYRFLHTNHGAIQETCHSCQSSPVQAARPEEIQHVPPTEEILMQRSFLFRVPGQHGMYDFDEIRNMNLPRRTNLAVTEVMKQHHSRDIGKMTVAAILSKFG